MKSRYVTEVKAALIADRAVWIQLNGHIGGLMLSDSRITLAEAEQLRDELERVIAAARGGCAY